ncbi:MAG: proline--tRNA ligase [Roseiflexus sp.]
MTMLFGRTLREAPSEVDHPSLRLLLRAGLGRLSSGALTLLPAGTRALRRIEMIVRDELTRIGSQEVSLPLFRAATLSESSGSSIASTLCCTDRFGRSLSIPLTDEEWIVSLALTEIASYRQLPALLYQVRPAYSGDCRLSWLRAGVTALVYALDRSDADFQESRALVRRAFTHLFERINVQVSPVEAGRDPVSGDEALAYVALSEHGDTDLMRCDVCGYAALREAARTASDDAVAPTLPSDEPDLPEEIATPNCATIADLARFCGVPEAATAKVVFFDSPERGLIFAIIRGDREVSTTKLRSAAGVSALLPARIEQINATGAVAGYASPVGLREWSSGSMVVIADPSVTTGLPLIAGANRYGYHLRNIVYGRDWTADLIADISLARTGDRCCCCNAPLRQTTGLVVGRDQRCSFQSVLSGATFLDQDGIARPITMGLFSITLERVLLAAIEQHCDRSGIVWPPEIAPFHVHLVRLGKQDATRQAADALYDELITAGITVLYDDRDETAGVKFNDADLLGAPLRLVIGDRFLSDGLVEIKHRAGGAITKTPRSEVLAAVQTSTMPV